jgi:hypothetical protein
MYLGDWPVLSLNHDVSAIKKRVQLPENKCLKNTIYKAKTIKD